MRIKTRRFTGTESVRVLERLNGMTRRYRAGPEPRRGWWIEQEFTTLAAAARQKKGTFSQSNGNSLRSPASLRPTAHGQ